MHTYSMYFSQYKHFYWPIYCTIVSSGTNSSRDPQPIKLKKWNWWCMIFFIVFSTCFKYHTHDWYDCDIFYFDEILHWPKVLMDGWRDRQTEAMASSLIHNVLVNMEQLLHYWLTMHLSILCPKGGGSGWLGQLLHYWLTMHLSILCPEGGGVGG